MLVGRLLLALIASGVTCRRWKNAEMNEPEIKPRPCARCGSTNTNSNMWTTAPYTFKPKPGKRLQFLCFECWKIEQDAYGMFLGDTNADTPHN